MIPETPSPAEIKEQKIIAFESAIGQTIPSTDKAFFRAFSKASAFTEALIYEFGKWAYNQIFVSTMDDDSLIKRGIEFGLYKTAPVSAILNATATGANDSVIPSGTLWQYEGIVYSQLADATISSGSASIQIEALTGGSDGNLDASVEIELVAPVSGIDDIATIVSTDTEGEDAETTEEFRTRVILRISQRPQGGAVPDYIVWALEVAGIVKAFAFNDGPNNVIVYPLQSLTVDRVPDSAKLTEVEDYINDPSIKPMCAEVTAEAMTEREITLVVSSYTPATSETRTAVDTAIDAYLLTCFPKQYPDESNPTNIIALSTLYAEARGAGATSIVMEMFIDGVPGAIEAYTLDDNEIIKLAGITWP